MSFEFHHNASPCDVTHCMYVTPDSVESSICIAVIPPSYESLCMNIRVDSTHDFLVDFSLEWSEKVEFSHNRKLCMGQKWQKLQIQDLLNFQNDTIFPHRS